MCKLQSRQSDSEWCVDYIKLKKCLILSRLILISHNKNQDQDDDDLFKGGRGGGNSSKLSITIAPPVNCDCETVQNKITVLLEFSSFSHLNWTPGSEIKK